jgi:hypothetical protein
MGALTRAELELALAADADVVAWSDEFVDWLRALGGGRVHVKLDSGMGRLGTRDAALAGALASGLRRARARAGRRDDAPGDRRGGRPGVHGRAARALLELGRAAARAPSRADRPRREQCRAARRRAGALRHGALRRRRLRPRPLRRRSGRMGSRARARAALLGRGGASRARSATAPATGDDSSPRADRAGGRSGRLRRRPAPPALQQRRGTDRRTPPGARRHRQHGQRDCRSRARAAASPSASR